MPKLIFGIMSITLVEAWQQFVDERSIALCPTSLTSDYKQTTKWAEKPQRDEDVIVIPREEVGILLAALEAKLHHRDVNWALYAEFMLQTAMRTGEVRAMKWDDIKDNRVLVHSNYTLTHGLKNSTKTNKRRSVPLNKKCIEIPAARRMDLLGWRSLNPAT
jgi:integrase